LRRAIRLNRNPRIVACRMGPAEVEQTNDADRFSTYPLQPGEKTSRSSRWFAVVASSISVSVTRMGELRWCQRERDIACASTHPHGLERPRSLSEVEVESTQSGERSEGELSLKFEGKMRSCRNSSTVHPEPVRALASGFRLDPD